MRVAVVSASLSESSSSTALGDRIIHQIAAQSADPVYENWIELRELAHTLTNSLLQGFASTEVAGTHRSLQEADALVAVTPIYQASYSGLFKLFFDVLPEGLLADKPVLLAATGGTGRHSLAIDHALRPLFAHLRALPTPVGGDGDLGRILGQGDGHAGRVVGPGPGIDQHLRGAAAHGVPDMTGDGGDAVGGRGRVDQGGQRGRFVRRGVPGGGLTGRFEGHAGVPADSSRKAERAGGTIL